MRAVGILLALSLAACGGDKPREAKAITDLECYILNDRSMPSRIHLDEKAGTFSINAGGLSEVTGAARFGSEEVWIELTSDGQGYIINRRDLSWRKINGPRYGQCEISQAPNRQF
jgi:hypothetical protein